MFAPPEKLKLDIVVFGYEKDKDTLKDLFAKLQGHLDNLNRTDIGVVFGLSDSVVNLEQVKGNLINMVVAPNYVLFDATESTFVLPNYIDSLAKLVDEDGDHADEMRALYGFLKK